MIKFTEWKNQSAVEEELVRSLAGANKAMENNNYGHASGYLKVASKCIEVLSGDRITI